MKRYEIALLLGLILISFSVYIYRLDAPSILYYDEIYNVETARNILQLSDLKSTAHPPLGRLIIAGSIALLGDHPWAWRLPSALAGILLNIVFFFVCRKLTRKFWIALLALFLFSLDGITMTQARIAMLNAPMLLSMMLSLLCIIPPVENPAKNRMLRFMLSGLFFGLAGTFRWVGFGIAPLLLIFIAKEFSTAKDKQKMLYELIIFFFFIPLMIYGLAHAFLLLYEGKSLNDLWHYQTNMFSHHLHATKWHPYQSDWWQWPLLFRPIWFYFNKALPQVDGVLCLGNPAILWLTPLTMGFMFWEWIKNKSFLAGFIIFGFLTQWLPWMLIPRTKFFHYYYVALPFICMATAVFLVKIWQDFRLGKIIVTAYLFVVLIMIIYWYPLWTDFPISDSYFRNHMWFRSWI